ncbi:hypothetical protein ACFLUO_04535 [Chloroflexota bacterium]
MKDKQPTYDEVVIKEYPNSTHLIQGQRVIAAGNLVLTSERLVFIHRIPISGEEIARLRILSAKITTREMIDLTIPFHKKNFQVPLSSIVSAKTGLNSFFPFPRPCLRISYSTGKRKQHVEMLTFMFTIPLWKGWFQLEITTVTAWVSTIRRVLRYRRSAAT